MKIVVYGSTDTRPFIYTLLKMLQPLGDIALFTDNLHYRRLIENGSESGSFENNFIVSSSESILDIMEEYKLDDDEFEYYIYDNKIPEEYDLFLYICGCKPMDYEEETLEYLDDNYTRVNFGFGDRNIPYTVEMFKRCEQIESNRLLMEVDPKISKKLAEIMHSFINMSPYDLRKVVSKRR